MLQIPASRASRQQFSHNGASDYQDGPRPLESAHRLMQDKCGLAFDYGSWFGGDRSGTHIRVNLATSRENIETMVRRITEDMK